jgi:hypothetical protein
MNGWTFAGWALAAIAFVMLMTRRREYEETIDELEKEREAVWEQISLWKPIVEAYAVEQEERARASMVN